MLSSDAGLQSQYVGSGASQSRYDGPLRSASPGTPPRKGWTLKIPAQLTSTLRSRFLAVRQFKKAGFTGDLRPRENIQTYNRWLSQGFKVKTGERSIRVKQFRLFHKSQVEFVGIPAKPESLSPEQLAEYSKRIAPRTDKTATPAQAALPL